MAIADLTPQDVLDQLEGRDERDLLRFITCGSVDDGKSTLIGRLLHEPGLLLEDQLAVLAADSKRVGTQGGELDFALLLDGLEAEREQGITIDVAYRYFVTGQRKFIVADTPGHEQYTRNMVTGASTADCAVLLVDARAGLLTQTRRHSHIVALLGIRHVVLAVNKLDLVDFSERRFRQIEAEYAAFACQIGLPEVTSIALSALHGDNVVTRSERTPWYDGPTLLEHLESVEVDAQRLQKEPLRMPVQWVNRPHADFRGFSGLIVSGTVRAGDSVILQPSGQRTQVERIVTYDGDLEEAVAGQSVTVTLRDEMDLSRGDVIASAVEPPAVGDRFQANLVWMADDPLLRGRSYLMRLGTSTVTATVAPVKHKVNIDTLERLAAEELRLNDIGVCELELDRPIVFDPYTANRDMGGFVLIDRISNATVGAGMLEFELRRSQNVHWQALDVDKPARASLNGHRGCVVWFTGLSGAGKSTIANLLERKLHSLGCHTYLLDGDNVRHGLNKDLGFTDADRVENIRRIAEVARLMADAGLIVLVASISPFRSERRMARELVEEGEFVEVFVDTPLDVAEARDPKHLYAKARRGEIRNFTGIDSPYEPPEAPELRIGTTATSPGAAVDLIRQALSSRRIL